MLQWLECWTRKRHMKLHHVRSWCYFHHVTWNSSSPNIALFQFSFSRGLAQSSPAPRYLSELDSARMTDRSDRRWEDGEDAQCIFWHWQACFMSFLGWVKRFHSSIRQDLLEGQGSQRWGRVDVGRWSAIYGRHLARQTTFSLVKMHVLCVDMCWCSKWGVFGSSKWYT